MTSKPLPSHLAFDDDAASREEESSVRPQRQQNMIMSNSASIVNEVEVRQHDFFHKIQYKLQFFRNFLSKSNWRWPITSLALFLQERLNNEIEQLKKDM